VLMHTARSKEYAEMSQLCQPYFAGKGTIVSVVLPSSKIKIPHNMFLLM
jgi:hypothetical protein